MHWGVIRKSLIVIIYHSEINSVLYWLNSETNYTRKLNIFLDLAGVLFKKSVVHGAVFN